MSPTHFPLLWESAGGGEVVVFIHAGIADSRMWDEQFAALSEQFRCIRYDLRGFGKSPYPPGPFSHAEDLAGLFSVAGIDSAALVGASMGGGVALDFALIYPERVSHLILAGSALGGHAWSSEVETFWAAEEAALSAGDVDAATELNLRMWVDGPNRQPSEVESAIRDKVRDMQRLAFENEIRSGSLFPPPSLKEPYGSPAATRLDEIEIPTLVLVGNQDVPDIREIAERLATEIPDARKAVIEGAAHMPNLERPEAFEDHLVRFLT